MVSQRSNASSEETVEQQKEGNTYDFPEDLEPWKSFSSECIKYAIPWDTISSGWLCYSSSDSEDLDVTSHYTTSESERKDPRQANPTPIDVVVISDDEEDIESSEKVAPVVLSKGYKPYRSVSVVRDFPIPPPSVQTPFPEDIVQKRVDSVGLVDPSETWGHEYVEAVPYKFISPIFPVDSSDSTSFKTKELRHKLSNAEDSLDAQSDSEENTYDVLKDLGYATPWDATSSGWVCYSSSDSEDLDVMPLYNTQESERKDPRQALDTPNQTPIDIVVISDDEEDKESAEKVTPVVLSRGYKPYRRVSAVRDFPVPPPSVQTPFPEDSVQKVAPVVLSKGYKPYRRVSVVRDFPIPPTSVQTPFPEDLIQKVLGSVGLVDPSKTCEHESMEEVASNFISPLVPVNTSDSTSFETKELFHKLSTSQDPLDAQSDSEGICCNSKLKNPHKPVPKRKAKTSMEAGPSCQGSTRKRRKH